MGISTRISMVHLPMLFGFRRGFHSRLNKIRQLQHIMRKAFGICSSSMASIRFFNTAPAPYRLQSPADAGRRAYRILFTRRNHQQIAGVGTKTQSACAFWLTTSLPFTTEVNHSGQYHAHEYLTSGLQETPARIIQRLTELPA